MRRLISVLMVAGTLAACDGNQIEAGDGTEPSPSANASAAASSSASATAESTPTPSPSASETASASATAEAKSNGAKSVSEQTDDYVFNFSYPAEAGKIPELAELLDKRLEARKADLARESVEARQEARDNGFPYNKHSYKAAWKVAANIPGWLSLSSDLSNYSGGAHGMYGFGSLVWDKEKAKAIKGIDMFESADALDQAVGERLCARLNAERQKRREEPVREDSEDEFDQCVSISDTTLLLGSAGKRKFDRITIQIGPYVAGPYVEGAYEFTFPVDALILKAVKPEYRGAFAARN